MNNSKIPAFPYDLSSFNGLNSDQITDALKAAGGLTKREYFAGLAMQSILVSFDTHLRAVHSDHHKVVCAEKSIAFADALLKELEK